MKNKVLINLLVPTLTEEFEIYIPVNERVLKVKKLLIDAVYDLSDNSFDKSKSYSLIDPETGNVYNDDLIIRDTNIRNAKKIMFFSN